ncbi:MAG: N-acetylmuramoyl-L-alanine amidase [Kurthia sp.]|nr:N-acetylmuramoyl-L-alanine amidase [Candidatus Kurthia equi]
MRNLIIAIVILAFCIPLAILGFYGTSMPTSIEYLQSDKVTEATPNKIAEVPIQHKVVANVPKNEQQKIEKTITKKTKKKKVIVIDPGHQRYADYRLEKVGPKSTKWMPKMPASTYGVSTGQAEYALTLQVAEYLQKQLKREGYRVKLTRQEHVIAMSTKERADFAKKNEADLYIQLHADGVTNAQAQGLYVISPAANNPFTKKTYRESQELARSITASAKKKKVTVYKTGQLHSESLSALNWATMPTILVELGYLNNPTDDRRLAQKDYQLLLAKSISQGVKAFDSK